MNILLTTLDYLKSGLLAQPLTSLIYLNAWLDPLLLVAGAAETFYYDLVEGEDALSLAWSICRFCFPEVYAQFTQALYEGLPLAELEKRVCQSISQHLPFPLDDLEAVRFGLPIEAYGIRWEDPETATAYPELAVLVSCLGFETWEDSESVGYTQLRQIGEILCTSLEAQPSPRHHDLAALLRWSLSISGNTLLDFTLDELWEAYLDLPQWSMEDIAFLREVAEEATTLYHAAQRGLVHLATDPSLRADLTRHVHLISTHLKKNHPTSKRRTRYDPHPTFPHALIWTDHVGDAAGYPTSHDA
jgi:hypothetical protein